MREIVVYITADVATWTPLHACQCWRSPTAAEHSACHWIAENLRHRYIPEMAQEPSIQVQVYIGLLLAMQMKLNKIH